MTVALVLGGASGIWRDVEAALDLGSYDGVVACNDAAAAWPGRLDALVTLHAEKAGLWLSRRKERGFPDPARLVGHETFKRGILKATDAMTDFVCYRFPGQAQTGSSGLFALKYALIDMGFDKAVLCGVPMTDTGAHFFDLNPWNGATSHKRGWVQAMPNLIDRAKSMSGWTEQQLGRPTKEWLAG